MEPETYRNSPGAARPLDVYLVLEVVRPPSALGPACDGVVERSVGACLSGGGSLISEESGGSGDYAAPGHRWEYRGRLRSRCQL
jgi:hypothetical protein